MVEANASRSTKAIKFSRYSSRDDFDANRLFVSPTTTASVDDIFASIGWICRDDQNRPRNRVSQAERAILRHIDRHSSKKQRALVSASYGTDGADRWLRSGGQSRQRAPDVGGSKVPFSTTSSGEKLIGEGNNGAARSLEALLGAEEHAAGGSAESGRAAPL